MPKHGDHPSRVMGKPNFLRLREHSCFPVRQFFARIPGHRVFVIAINNNRPSSSVRMSGKSDHPRQRVSRLRAREAFEFPRDVRGGIPFERQISFPHTSPSLVGPRPIWPTDPRTRSIAESKQDQQCDQEQADERDINWPQREVNHNRSSEFNECGVVDTMTRAN